MFIIHVVACVFFFYPSDAHFNHIHFMFALSYTHTYRIRCDVITHYNVLIIDAKAIHHDFITGFYYKLIIT